MAAWYQARGYEVLARNWRCREGELDLVVAEGRLYVFCEVKTRTTDEFGARAVENKVHIHDLHATVMALLGFDHTKLTYRYNGRDFRLTDNFGNVVKDIIA